MAGLGCVIPCAGDCGIPNRIVDFGTLTIALDNQGVATVSLIIITKSDTPYTNLCFTLSDYINNIPVDFKGFLDSDTPKRLEGTDYYEHALTAKGVICGSAGGAGVITPATCPGGA